MKLSLTIFLILYSFGLFGQTDSSAIYLAELKKELFKPGDEKINLYKLIYCSPADPDWQQIDSTKMVRAAQPDPKIAIELLRKIMFSKNPKLIKEVKMIYDRHMNNFMEEWSQVFLDNYYMCESIKGQFQILSGFEQVLTSLKISLEKTKPNQVFQLWVELSFLLNQKDNGPSKDYIKFMRDYNYHSFYMHKLNPFHPYDLYVAPFYFIDPWLKSIETYYINFLLKCNCFYDIDKPMSDSCNFIHSNFNFYEGINDNRLIDYFIKNGENWVKNMSYLIFSYASKNYNEQLSNVLIDQLISLPDLIRNKDTNNKKERMFRILTQRDTRNFPLVLNKLLILSEKDPEKALVLSKLLPYDLMEEYSKNYILILQKMRKERMLTPLQYYNNYPNKDGN